ncbi:DUF6059 family protein [Kitasatospora sp. NPDC087314]|uniref:DUF6059 family protein n=1 Tax=Kitasatospora sp. NPDC087314 TaxID=3364068 RepID=UPI0037F35D54
MFPYLLRRACDRALVALGWLGLYYAPVTPPDWLPGQDAAGAAAATPPSPRQAPPPGHPDRRGAIRLSREEERLWAQLNDAW